MIFRRTVCLLALAAGASAFAPPNCSGNAAGRKNDLVAMNIATSPVAPVLQDFEHETSDRLPYSPTGYSTWEWKTIHNPTQQEAEEKGQPMSSTQTSHSINYLEMGDPTKPALILVHGFGASAYHWRHNIPTLAREYHVYALDLLGFGWSDKPVMDYDASVWRDQVVDFVKEIVGDDRSLAIAGNSLGGYTAMYASADERIKHNVKACMLLNAAGRFRDPEEAEEKGEPNPIIKAVSAAIQRFVIACSFVYTKQPMRIEQVLKQVYPINDANVDSELVESIQTPALESTAAEVFYRVITKNGSGPQAYVDDILKELECPVALVWGESDPWIKSATADKLERLHAEFHGDSRIIRRMSIDAGKLCISYLYFIHTICK